MSPPWRRLSTRYRNLRALIKETLRALREVSEIVEIDPSLSAAVSALSVSASRAPALVVLGGGAARARLLHALLGRRLLPDHVPRGCRWLRIQYGSSTQVHLTLGNSEFELVEELECNKGPWETLPVQDLLRQDNTDLATMLEIELNNSFLNGLKIIVPPDIEVDPGPVSYKTIKKLHKDLYSKRETILKNFNCIYLFALDKMSKTDNIFFDNMTPKMMTSLSDEEFWNTFNLYHMGKMAAGEGDGAMMGEGDSDTDTPPREGDREMAVLSGENCLDLHQIKEINPSCQVLFTLFSDCAVPDDRVQFPDAALSVDAYNSAELPESDQGWLNSLFYKNVGQRDPRRYDDQVTFMNELLDQWGLMSPPPSKHYVKSQYLIIDDAEILRNPELTSNTSKPNQPVHKDAKREKDALNESLKEIIGDKTVTSRSSFISSVMKYCVDCQQSYLLEHCTKLSEVHVKLVQALLLASFSLARDLQVLPTRVSYVATQEQLLYENIVDKFSKGDKKQELVQLMQEVLEEMKSEVENMDWSVDDLPWHQDRKYQISNSIFYSARCSPHISYQLSDGTTVSDPSNTLSYPSNTLSYPSNTMSYPSNTMSDPSNMLSETTLRSDRNDVSSDAEEAESYDCYNFDDYEIIQSNEESWSVSEFRRNLSKSSNIRVETESRTTMCDSTRLSIKEATLDVQKTVLSQLSRKISIKLVNFVDCLSDTYFGTLQRCLCTLEARCGAAARASALCAEVRAAATAVTLAPAAATTWLHTLLHALLALLNKFRIVSDEGDVACCVLSPAWRRNLATETVNSLSSTRLARIISVQILERVSSVHDRYQAALASLKSALANRLHQSEDVKLAIRKKHAPGMARLCLESTSMCDLLMYGVPELGRVIGSGQYGVVHAVRGRWAGAAAAAKCVAPHDDRHLRELAMEFYYTRCIPPHPRVVRLLGSIWRGAAGVILISERKRRDLHAAVQRGLSFVTRIQIALDIVEGIRYLHSLGLVHRDIKMKNVLLDSEDRAALSDLGFCACEALMTGSIVGTPIHMAPDLLTSDYDASVDVYAFAILFWYLCAGTVRLPSSFEFQNKETLWTQVKQGLRPERLPQFSDECWDIMTQCWASDPAQRAHLGDIQPRLQNILDTARNNSQGEEAAGEGGDGSEEDSDV